MSRPRPCALLLAVLLAAATARAAGTGGSVVRLLPVPPVEHTGRVTFEALVIEPEPCKKVRAPRIL